jgi:glycosyltransferase involved in cell wall biosynthesis
MGLTIITVTYNAAEALQKTILNIATFKGSYDEYIVVDGGSTDETIELLSKSSSVVTHWLSETDSGIYDAMNKGWRLANYRNHILYLGAGDRIVSLPKSTCGFAHSVLFGDVEMEGRGLFRGSADFRLMFGNTLHHQALLVPKVIHPDPPFNCIFPTYADFDFNLRLRRAGARFARDSSLRSFASGNGVSHKLNLREMVSVCRHNYGATIAIAARVYLKLLEIKSNLRFRK